MRTLPDFHGDDWLPEDDDNTDNEEEAGSYSEDYDMSYRDFEQEFEDFWR